VRERWGVRKRTSNLGQLLDPTKFLTMSEFNRSTGHDGQDRVDVLRSRVSALLDALGEILFDTKYP
jgi:hypothetical protein